MSIWFFSKIISVPLKTLEAAAKRIEGGQFDVDFDIKNHDEIGTLGTVLKKCPTHFYIR
jgi:nitrate/nitrite-specific signal transduction histidine kinase